jgi:hypothetical protein
MAMSNHYDVYLSDAVTDIEGNRLEANTAPRTGLSATDASLSQYPSNDVMIAGGFHMITTLPTEGANVGAAATDAFLENFANNNHQFAEIFDVDGFTGSDSIGADQDSDNDRNGIFDDFDLTFGKYELDSVALS